MRRVVLPAGSAVLVAAVLAAALWGGLFASYRSQASDALFPLGTTTDRIAVVAIDTAALEKTNERWPWPRSLQARLVDAIAAAKPKVIVLDIVYSPATADDGALAASLQHAGNVVIASLAQLARTREGLYQVRVLTSPVPSVGEGLLAAHGSITPDPVDGVARSVPLVIEDAEHNFVPSLSLAALARLEKLPEIVTLRPGGLQLGGRFIPTERRSRLRVAYPDGLSGLGGERALISAADVLAGTVASDRLAGKAVFVGVTDSALGDLHATPVDKGAGAPGVLIHASALNTMLTRNYIAPAGRGETLLWMLALGLGVAFGTFRLRLWLAALVAGVAIVGYLLIGFVRFNAGTLMDFVFPPLAVALTFVLSLSARVLIEAGERRRVTGLLEQYVPMPVAKHLLARGRSAGLPATGQLTFLFTDVVGSTEAWEAYPREMGEAMRCHDGLVEEAVETAGGAVVRPRGEGDSRFCVFVNPVDAARAALAIDRAMRGERWCTREPVKVRMGINTGDAELREADYYGSAVNRCARIRGVANAGEIMLSEVTARLVEGDLGPDALVDRGYHALKGMVEPEHVFELLPSAASPAAR
jgi:CHASE2 domain-containing sensor protein